MNKLFRALIAGYGAKKLGGGCLSTVLIFLLIYWALGNCNCTAERISEYPSTLIQERTVAMNAANKTMQSFYLRNIK